MYLPYANLNMTVEDLITANIKGASVNMSKFGMTESYPKTIYMGVCGL